MKRLTYFVSMVCLSDWLLNGQSKSRSEDVAREEYAQQCLDTVSCEEQFKLSGKEIVTPVANTAQCQVVMEVSEGFRHNMFL